jgi:hypothetical protein
VQALPLSGFGSNLTIEPSPLGVDDTGNVRNHLGAVFPQADTSHIVLSYSERSFPDTHLANIDAASAGMGVEKLVVNIAV